MMSFPPIQHTGIYFSGYFTFDLDLTNQKKFESHFEYSNFFESNKNYLSQKYYNNWLSTLYPDPTALQNWRLVDFKSNHLVYSDNSNKKFTIKTTDKEISFTIGKIEIFLFREGLAIFSINVLLPREFENFDDISALTAALRNTMANDKAQINNVLADVIEEKITPSFSNDPYSWRKYNPHLKVFLNIDVKENFSDKVEWNYLLMELAMVIPPGTISSKGLYAPSEKYSKQLFENNVIDVFNNWKAICLLDSLVRISVNLKEADRYNLWETDYYNIYVFTSFIRFYLYLTNTKLSKFSHNIKESAKLRNEFVIFMNDFDLSQISYKFLPNIIYKNLLYSMEIKDELNRMEQKLRLIDTAVRESQSRKTESFLKVIAFFPMFTIILSAVTLIKMQIGSEPSIGIVRMISIIVASIVFLIVLYIYLKQKKK